MLEDKVVKKLDKIQIHFTDDTTIVVIPPEGLEVGHKVKVFTCKSNLGETPEWLRWKDRNRENRFHVIR